MKSLPLIHFALSLSIFIIWHNLLPAQTTPELKKDTSSNEVEHSIWIKDKNALRFSLLVGGGHPKGEYGDGKHGLRTGTCTNISLDHFWKWWGLGGVSGHYINCVSTEGFGHIGGYYGIGDRAHCRSEFEGFYYGVGPSFNLGNGMFTVNFKAQGGLMNYSFPGIDVHTYYQTPVAYYPKINVSTGFWSIGTSVILNLAFLSLDFRLDYLKGTNKHSYTYTYRKMPPGNVNDFEEEDYMAAPFVKGTDTINPHFFQVKFGFSVWLWYEP